MGFLANPVITLRGGKHQSMYISVFAFAIDQGELNLTQAIAPWNFFHPDEKGGKKPETAHF